MDESLREQIESHLPHLQEMVERGRKLRDALEQDPLNVHAALGNRAWQADCGAIVNQLSGGSKAHWLSRSYSQAFLMRSTAGSFVEQAAPADIVDRLVAVLEQALVSLAKMGDGTAPASTEAPPPRRFDFVHDPELRPVVEQAYSEGGPALDEGRHDQALLTSCGILEAIVTDALEHRGLEGIDGIPSGPIGEWPFEARLAAAERAGLIRGGWARLSPVARKYRDPGEDAASGASERDAKQARQVLHVVMRDLNPGR
jgi:hypothetical protein